ncbi:MAG TPA: glycosyltransferase [Flavobacterium sp.]|nr:glycosyltransferase [Flavobacterium sp.]
MKYSIVIPVYNRPDEIEELLESLLKQTYQSDFEVVVVEDGSQIDCQNIVEKYNDRLTISYHYKSNSGPGDSRNYGMQKAKGDYFIIFDSDCIIPPEYLELVEQSLQAEYVDCFGGPDAALPSFSQVQKAIDYTMTSVLTTGGIRGASEKIGKFQPRSFNMGISKKAFQSSGGFGKIHPGEDPDLSIRLWKSGFETKLIPEAFVYHKRRIDWKKFYIQVNKFGKARPILDAWHPEYTKITYWFPLIFIAGLAFSLLTVLFGIYIFIGFYLLYFVLLLADAWLKTKSFRIAILSIRACLTQFYGYAIGFAKAKYHIDLLKRNPEKAMPEMFFK